MSTRVGPALELPDSEWVRVQKISMFRREIRESLSPFALDYLFSHCELLVEGDWDKDRKEGAPGVAYASVMATMDLKAAQAQLCERIDDAMAHRFAELLMNEKKIEKRLIDVVRAKFEKFFSCSARFLDFHVDHRARAKGCQILLDGDVSAKLIAGNRRKKSGQAEDGLMSDPIIPANSGVRAGSTDHQRQVSESLYSAADVARLFEIPEGRVRYWSQTGFISPSARNGSRRFYSFRDLVSIRVARDLLKAGLSLQRVRRSLDALKLHLPEIESPLSKLRVRGDLDRIVVDDGESSFEASTGQLLLDFDLNRLAGRIAEVLTFPSSEEREAEKSGQLAASEFGNKEQSQELKAGPAFDYFALGQAHEGRWDGIDPDDPEFVSAKNAYEKSVEFAPAFAPAWTNLGSLSARIGDLNAARDYFDQALTCDPNQCEARCNLAELAFRDGELELAVNGFREVVQYDPQYFEAHYGLARTLLKMGSKSIALAHLERFCRILSAGTGPDRGSELHHRLECAQQAASQLRNELGKRAELD